MNFISIFNGFYLISRPNNLFIFSEIYDEYVGKCPWAYLFLMSSLENGSKRLNTILTSILEITDMDTPFPHVQFCKMDQRQQFTEIVIIQETKATKSTEKRWAERISPQMSLLWIFFLTSFHNSQKFLSSKTSFRLKNV